MRNSALKSLTVWLNHESQASRGVSATGQPFRQTAIKTVLPHSGVALLGGKASALIRSVAPPQRQTPPAS
jgi:hypothetical protein